MQRFAKLTENNCEQIEFLAAQNQRIEEFLEEIVTLLKKNQKTSVDLNQKLITAEADFGLYKKELSDLFKDFENRYGYFQQVTSQDAGNMLKIQKETNRNLESFMSMITKKNNTIEETMKERIDSFQKLLEEMSKRELNDELLKSISADVASVMERIGATEHKFDTFDNSLSNFKNEMHTLFVDFETDLNQKWQETNDAIVKMAKSTGVRNPLI